MAGSQDALKRILGGAGIQGDGAMDTSQLTAIAINGASLVENISKLIQTLSTILPFSGTFGSFTCSAAASTTVPQPAAAANSFIVLMPTNAAAGTLMGSTRSLYVSARTAGTSFTVTSASGVAASGTEAFSYILINPS
jgi:hypothetical protein